MPEAVGMGEGRMLHREEGRGVVVPPDFLELRGQLSGCCHFAAAAAGGGGGLSAWKILAI